MAAGDSQGGFHHMAMAAHGHMGAPKKEDGFLGEMRAYAMKLHTKEQAPKEGQAEEPSKPMSKWEPTRELYAQVRAPPPRSPPSPPT